MALSSFNVENYVKSCTVWLLQTFDLSIFLNAFPDYFELKINQI